MLTTAKRIVIKIGSSLLADEENGRVREAWLAALAEDIHQLHQQKKQIIVVTSGAVALGRLQLGIKSLRRWCSSREKQAAAACGQICAFERVARGAGAACSQGGAAAAHRRRQHRSPPLSERAQYD